eukprot:scaffold6596_cov64-Phaeocystis_antarctica.AAC.1
MTTGQIDQHWEKTRWILGERLDHRFEFLEPYGSCRVVRSQEAPGSAEVARGVPKLRGTVSGCLSHTKVFHRDREHAKLLTIANGRRRSKAVTEPADVSETTVGDGMGSSTRENWANPSA